MDGIEVIVEENVLIQAGCCAVTILPRLGGKIASIRVGELELLQRPLAPYAPRTRTMSFDAGDASGWDECLPSVAACTVETAGGTASIPDHGDLWRVEWRSRDQGTGDREQELGTRDEGLGNKDSRPGVVALAGECFSLPLTLERTVRLTETALGWELRLDYSVRNTGDFSVPWSWAAHPLFVAEAGDRIVLPGSIETLRLEGSGGERLGSGGDTVNWPMALLADGNVCDLSLAQGIESGIGDKLFAGPLRLAENWCALERPRAGVRIKVDFDAAAMPYLGLWICYGGWPERPGPKQMCVAMEPATAPVDSLAETGPWSQFLASGESYQWPMTVAIESIKGV
jgi:galactose mutarotase-like enzyme